MNAVPEMATGNVGMIHAVVPVEEITNFALTPPAKEAVQIGIKLRS
jgi:hypothetical protein